MAYKDPGDAAEEALREQIRRFPEQFPRSIGGLRPDKSCDEGCKKKPD